MSGWTLDGSPEKLPVPQVPVVEFLNLAGINGTPRASSRHTLLRSTG